MQLDDPGGSDDDGDYDEDDACGYDASDGGYGEGGDAVDGKAEHFGEWVFGFSGCSCLSVVVGAACGVAQLGDEAADEEIALGVGDEGFGGSVAHEAEVGVIDRKSTRLNSSH